MIRICWYIVFSVVFLLPAACKRGGCNVVQDIIVNRSFFLGEYPELRVQGGYAISDNGGVAGLIVLNTGNGYVAYDRCSTVNPHLGCAVEVEESGLVAKDPCSGARYLLINGSPAEIAECPLKPYHARRNGETILVSN